MSPNRNQSSQAPADTGGTCPPDAEPADGPRFLPPLKPRPRLLLALAILCAAWLLFLLVLYFISVYPDRYGPHRKPAPTVTPEGISP